MSQIRKVFTSEIRSIDEKEMTLTAYISTDTVDRMGEVLDPAGLDVKNYRKNPVVLWAHDYSLPPIGKALWVKRDGQGVISKVKFAGTAFAQEIFQLYKEGFLKAFSVGFMPTKKEDGDGEKKPRCTYKQWELLEYSAVPVPANPDAIALAIQKGFLKTTAIKDALEHSNDEDWGGIMEEQPQEEIKEVVVEEKKEEVKQTGLEEIEGENSLLTKENEDLKKQLEDTRYKLYVALNKQPEKKPEIAVDTLANKVADIVDGAIRKAQGKV